MINSMTGFGRGNAGRGKDRIDVEIRAINSRYLDTKYSTYQAVMYSTQSKHPHSSISLASTEENNHPYSSRDI